MDPRGNADLATDPLANKDLDLSLKSYEENRQLYDHPDLPDWIGLREKKTRYRSHPIREALEKARQRQMNEKVLRCREYAKKHAGNVPPTFTENTNKEKLILEHVKRYAEQFAIAYKTDRKLFLCPKNECDVEKFISTTIRPTKMGYLEFYDFKQCAAYIANFILYEPLDNPLQFPEYIPSPTSVIEWQKGDCFDISILLCSILIGVGYDAYCVIGKAPYEITLKNEGLMSNPYINAGLEGLETRPPEAKPFDGGKYTVEEKASDESKYDKRVDKLRSEQEAEKNRRDNDILDDDEPDRLPPDEFEGQRIHCWVLIKKGKRDVKEDTFVEPTTGRCWELRNKDYPYLLVDQVFNNKNYWVNLKVDRPVHLVPFQHMDNGELDDWEYVMIDTVKFPTFDGMDEDEDEVRVKKQETDPKKKALGSEVLKVQNVIKEIAHLVDMPLPWAPKLFIDKDKFLRGPPMGEVTRFYYKSRVDIYTKYMQIDGLTTKLTLYDDYSRTLVKEVRCIYSNRRNNLIVRRRFPNLFKTVEYYKPNFRPNYRPQGASDSNNFLPWPHWKKIEEVDRRHRIIDYYPYRHTDGLIKRHEILGADWPEHRQKLHTTKEYYEGRDDYLTFRSFSYVTKELDDYNCFSFPTCYDKVTGYIVRMTQHFDKNPNKDGHEQVAKMDINLSNAKNCITVTYHLNDGEIAPIISEYERKNLTGVMTTTADGFENAVENPELQARHQKIYNMEKDCLQNIKDLESNIKQEFTTFRDKEEEIINQYKDTNNLKDALINVLEKSLNDKAREKFGKASQKAADQTNMDTGKEDLLLMYLDDKSRLTKNLDQNTAKQIRADIIQKFKQRIYSRADIIEKRIKEEKQKLDQLEKKKEKRLADAGDDKKEEVDKNADEIMELQNSVNILEARAMRFEAAAMEGYRKLQEALERDDRLAVLRQNM